MKSNHVMIDLETLDTRPSAAIVSIGAVIFDPRTGVCDDGTLYMELDWRDQVEFHDRTKDPDTVAWWKKQPAIVRASLNPVNPIELPDALEILRQFIPAEDSKVWANGDDFDIPILDDAYYKDGSLKPWKFWNTRDCRTIKDLYQSMRGEFQRPAQDVRHNALEDAKQQAFDVCHQWASILKGD